MTYEVKQTFGGFQIVNSDNGATTGEIYTGTGAKALAQADADKLNGGETPKEESIVEQENDQAYVRGSGREGRGG